MIRRRFALTILVLLGTPLWASACSFVGLEHEVAFKPGQVTLEASEIGRLANWYVDKKILHGVGEVGIFVSAIKSDARSSSLGRERLASIADVVASLDGPNGASVSRHVTEIDAQSAKAPLVADTAEVIVQPACLKTHTCCPVPGASDGLRKP